MDKDDGQYYDGTRKGSGCCLWRKDSGWLEVDYCNPRPSELVRRTFVKTVKAPWRLSDLGSATEHGFGPQDRVDAYYREKDRESIPDCPRCHSKRFVKRHGSRTGQKMFYCHPCGHSFVLGSKKQQRMKYYLGSVNGKSSRVVCERHREKLMNESQFVGIGLSCFFCGEEAKMFRKAAKKASTLGSASVIES